MEQIRALPASDLNGVGFSTLSIGGNNVGFARVLKSCIFFQLKGCGAERTRTETRIASDDLQTNLTQSYRQILASMPVLNFKLYVTGYARFFNAIDARCNSKYIVPIPLSPKAPRAELTQELRQWVNDDVIKLNNEIEQAVATVNAENAAAGSAKKVVFVNIDIDYETHRFCDNWPNWKSDAWFFGPGSGDATAQTGTSTDWDYPLSNDIGIVDVTKIDATTCTDDADESGDWGQMFMCGFAQLYAENHGMIDPTEVYSSDPDDEDAGQTTSIQFNAFPTTWLEKAFHPKTIALAAEAYQVWLFWYVHCC